MSFDARSLERLQQLGRSLPQPLPVPETPQVSATPGHTPASGQRHKVETETDPEALFRELMQVSPDGNVPPHLMDRLREAEQDQQRRRRIQQLRELQSQGPLNHSTSASVGTGMDSEARNRSRRSSRAQRRDTPTLGRSRMLDPETQDQYIAFQHLLLEDDDSPAT